MTPQERRQFKTQAHTLKAVVMIGQHGLTDNVLAAIKEALTAHQLIKIKLPADKQANQTLVETICSQLDAEHIQTVGHVATLYRQNPDR